MSNLTILVTDQKGQDHVLEAFTGWSLMEVLRDYQMGVKGECGGGLSCATCHVYIDPSWWDRLPPPTCAEQDMLDKALSALPQSRLSCQIVLTTALEGLHVTVAPN